MILSVFIYAAVGLSLFVILTTLLPLAKHGHWIIRSCDFPRMQLAIMGAVLLLVLGILQYFYQALPLAWFILLCLALGACLFYQCLRIYPYTVLHAVEVKDVEEHHKGNRIRLMSSNILQTNREYQRLIELVNKQDPDVLCLLETDQQWKDGVAPLYQLYPEYRDYVTDNLYGMIVLSKFPIIRSAIKERVQADIPSISLDIDVHGEEVRMYFVHPMPPSPTEAETSDARDAELILVGKEVDQLRKAVIVAGDLNDVAWSDTTRLFRKISGLLDPRIGRGFFNTFHTGLPFMRWPLDHVFHSHHFRLGYMKRLENIGSDHFPIFIELHLADQSCEHSEKKSDRELSEREEELQEVRLDSLEK